MTHTEVPGTTGGRIAPLTGWRGDHDYFRFAELDRLDADAVLDVLLGRRLGVVFRGVIDAAASAELVRRFWDSPVRKRRGGEVCESLGYYVGAYHYHKPTDRYLDESAEVAPHLDDLLDVPDEPTRWFRAELDARLRRDGARLRPAEQGGRPACPVLVRHWNAQGAFALQPHEDSSQLGWPEQAGFEIQRTTERVVAAVNMCLENGEGGRLVVWNVVPDLASRTRLGLELSGSPYPVESTAGHDSLWLEVRPGDIYVFNGGHVHGVEASAPGAKRTTMAWNMGFCDDRNVVTWT
ncbi:hypothetical protein [Saccharothrix syringae]|uniref:Fe2OG dioxygenase domain-containing protein n=1 Tax=Saccharothrix syringae TaxID=103733 RepID=A0A5Q0H237_SACSY|nr:hypothetical protein [Saccharothrix syringae]QFZ20173.1 hypothetical protein EKG83_24640 [Saccharothrix syringae]